MGMYCFPLDRQCQTLIAEPLDLCRGHFRVLGLDLHRLHDSLHDSIFETPPLVCLGCNPLVSIPMNFSSIMADAITASSGLQFLAVSGNSSFMRILRVMRVCSAWRMPSGWISSTCFYGSLPRPSGLFNSFELGQEMYGRSGELRCSWWTACSWLHQERHGDIASLWSCICLERHGVYEGLVGVHD